MRDLRLFFLIVLVLVLFASTLFSANVSNILQLWEIRDNLGGTYTLTTTLDLEDTNPETIVYWVTSTSYATGDIVEHPTDGYAYYCDTTHTSGSSFTSGNWTKMWEVSKGWQPIGTESTPFHGNFDGGGKIISNLYINRKADDHTNNNTIPPNGENHVGLFGYVTNGSSASNASNSADIYIKNLGMTNVTIKGKRGTGALIGKILLPNKKKKKIVITENCYVSGGTVSGFGATGGLVGANNSDIKHTVPILRYSYANVTVSSTHPANQKLNSGDNNNPYNIKYGGLVGCNENGVTQDSYANGNVSGGDRVGGLAGCTIGGAIFRCYATGDVTQGISSSSWEGGYGPITGKTQGKLPPGLGGTNATGSIEDSYYLSTATVSGTTDGNTYGTGQTSPELIAATAYSNWDSTVWDFSTDYPTLGSSPSSMFHFISKNTTGSFSTASDWKSSTDSIAFSQSALKPDYTNSYSIKVLSGNTITITNGKDAYVSTAIIDGKLIVANGGTLHVEHKSPNDSDLIVNGELEVTGSLNIGQSAIVTGATNSTIILNGSTTQTIATGLTSVYNLTINNSAGVTLPDNIVINGTLDVSTGNYTGPTNIEVDGLNSPTVKRLSWVKTNYNIKNYSGTTAVSALFPTYINRSWNISGNIAEALESNREKTITFYWDATEDNSYDWVNLNSLPILFEGGTKIAEPTTTSLSGATRSATFKYTFSQSVKSTRGNLNIGLDGDNTLPVQLSTFDAFNYQNNSAMIQWITQSESNLDGYRLFRNNNNSLDTSIMLDVFISGTNTSQSQTYSHLDETITEDGIYYYWIQMIDYDGTNSFYGPAILQVDDDFNHSVDVPHKTGFVSIYPNPFNPTTSFRYYLEHNSKVEIQVYNIIGQLVKSFNLGNETKGFHSVIWNGKNNNNNDLPSGVYFTKMITNNKTDLKKIILMK